MANLYYQESNMLSKACNLEASQVNLSPKYQMKSPDFESHLRLKKDITKNIDKIECHGIELKIF